MWHDIILLYHVTMTKKVNGLFYFLQKIPFLGKKIPSRIYQFIRLKKILSIFSFIFSMISSAFKNFFYLFIFYMLPIMFLYIKEDPIPRVQMQQVFFLMFTIFTIQGAFTNSKMWTCDDETLIMIKQLHMESKRYMLHHSLFTYTINTISLGISALPICMILMISPAYALLIAISYVCSHLAMDACYLYLYERYHSLILYKKAYKPVISIFCLLLAYGILLSKITISIGYMSMYIFTIISFLGLAFTYHYLKSTMIYKNVMRSIIQDYLAFGLKDVTNTQTLDVALNEKDYSKSELTENIHHKKHGYQFMNALFFKRHKRLIYKPIKYRIIILSVIMLFVIISSFFIKDVIDERDILELMPPFVFFLYMLNISQRTCKAMFMNCDASLLHYGYYRTPQAILTNFRIRLKALILYNLPVTILLCLLITITCIFYRIPFTFQTMALFHITMLLLSIFFSVHYLFIYYIVQPYDEKLEIRNPLMNIVNGAIYLLCYLCINLDGNLYFSIGVLAATLLYLVIALPLVWHFAPKTFHLK